MNFLTFPLVKFRSCASTPEEAIAEAGNLLVGAGMARSSYVDAMQASFHKNGPYFVIAPAIAIPHARPEDGALASAVSLVTLANPVCFGSQANDPVQIVFGLAAYSGQEHLAIMQKVVSFLQTANVAEKLINLKTVDELRCLIEEIS